MERIIMTTKRFSKYVPDICNGYTVTVTIVDNETGKQSASVDDFVDLLNEQHEENEQCKMMIATLLEENQSIKKHIEELYNYVKIDVDNEIEVYPKALLEGIVDILKIICDVK